MWLGLLGPLIVQVDGLEHPVTQCQRRPCGGMGEGGRTG
jgi:hypothetical protein